MWKRAILTTVGAVSLFAAWAVEPSLQHESNSFALLPAAHAQACIGCPPPPPPPPGGGAGSGGGASTASKAGQAAAMGVPIGVGTAATALIVRGGYTNAVHNRELYYGEAFCTIENFGLTLMVPMKGIRLFADLASGQLTPVQDILFCPEAKLNQYSVAANVLKKPKLKKKVKKKSLPLPRPKP